MTSVIGIFKGGGAKGSLYEGALRAVHERGISFSQVAGTSAGAITAAFLAAGATPEELRAFGDEAVELGLAALPSPLRGARRLRNHHGVLPLDELEAWLAQRLNCLYRAHLGGGGAGVSGPTFEQLTAAGGVPLHVVAADLKWRTPVVFNAELTPHLAVAHAAAASSAIPFVYESPLLLDLGGAGRSLSGFLVADGGVLANLPLFIFTDPGYRALAGLPAATQPAPVVAFALDSQKPPLPGEDAVAAHDAYRRRYRDRTAVVTWSTLRAELAATERADTREAQAGRKQRPREAPGFASRAVRGMAELLVRILDGGLRVVELVVLPPLNTVLRWAARDAAPVTRGSGSRARRWSTFVERAFNVAPGYLFIATALLPFVLAFGLPAVVVQLWPDWASLVEDQGFWERVVAVGITGVGLLLAGIGLVVVVMVVLVGLAGYAVGWAALPAAKEVGGSVLATFMRSPQEPPWAGLAPNVTIVRIDVPKGWTALKTTRDRDELDHLVSCVRLSVHEQLDEAGLGVRPTTPLRTGGG